MRFSAFVPAVLALSVFTFSTQALPTPAQEGAAVEILKRGGSSPSNVLDALVRLFVKVETKVIADACVDLTAKVCADLDIKLNAKAKVLGGLLETELDVSKLTVEAKAEAKVSVKALVEAHADVLVIANIDAHVKAVALKLCPVLSIGCVHDNAHKIVAQVVARIKIDVQKLAVKVKADAEAHVKARLDVAIPKLALNLGPLATATIKSTIKLKAKVDIRLKAFVELCVKLLANVKLVADIRAL
ncbi:hypothetical protein BG004_001021 [Podila humilis]|nr:hypothetical protein BG004_001021 [Podila humilis]